MVQCIRKQKGSERGLKKIFMTKDIKEGKTMKQTKANIYAAYGIEYDAAQDKIYHNYFGWIPALLINGNDKLG